MAERVDPLGLRTGKADRLLPALVAAQAFVAALALAGALAAAALAGDWRGETASALTVQVTSPNDPARDGSATRIAEVLTRLRNTPGVAAAHQLTPDELDALLRPWLGADAAALDLALPAVITARWTGGASAPLAAALESVAPGTLVTTGAGWAGRVATLTASIRACAVAILVLVALVAAAAVAIATRARLALERGTIEIIHGLGALDSDIASRFANRATALAAFGAAAGTVAALPVLAWLTALAAPFAAGIGAPPDLPSALLLALPALTPAAAVIGWGTTQVTVRRWLRGVA